MREQNDNRTPQNGPRPDRNDRGDRGDRTGPPPQPWDQEPLRTFTKDKLAVSVMRQPGRTETEYPRYAIVLGAALPDGRRGARINVMIQGGQVSPLNADTLLGLIGEAEAFIQTEVSANRTARGPGAPSGDFRGHRGGDSPQRTAMPRGGHEGGNRGSGGRNQGPVLGLKELAKRDKAAWAAAQAKKAAEAAQEPVEASPAETPPATGT